MARKRFAVNLVFERHSGGRRTVMNLLYVVDADSERAAFIEALTIAEKRQQLATQGYQETFRQAVEITCPVCGGKAS